MSNIWKEKMNEYYMRKKYNLKKNEKIFKHKKQYYYGLIIFIKEVRIPKCLPASDGALKNGGHGTDSKTK